MSDLFLGQTYIGVKKRIFQIIEASRLRASAVVRAMSGVATDSKRGRSRCLLIMPAKKHALN